MNMNDGVWESGRKVRVKRGKREGVLDVNVGYMWRVELTNGETAWFIQEQEIVLIEEEVTDAKDI